MFDISVQTFSGSPAEFATIEGIPGILGEGRAESGGTFSGDGSVEIKNAFDPHIEKIGIHEKIKRNRVFPLFAVFRN